MLFFWPSLFFGALIIAFWSIIYYLIKPQAFGFIRSGAPLSRLGITGWWIGYLFLLFILFGFFSEQPESEEPAPLNGIGFLIGIILQIWLIRWSKKRAEKLPANLQNTHNASPTPQALRLHQTPIIEDSANTLVLEKESDHTTYASNQILQTPPTDTADHQYHVYDTLSSTNASKQTAELDHSSHPVFEPSVTLTSPALIQSSTLKPELNIAYYDMESREINETIAVIQITEQYITNKNVICIYAFSFIQNKEVELRMDRITHVEELRNQQVYFSDEDMLESFQRYIKS